MQFSYPDTSKELYTGSFNFRQTSFSPPSKHKVSPVKEVASSFPALTVHVRQHKQQQYQHFACEWITENGFKVLSNRLDRGCPALSQMSEVRL